VWHLFVVLTKHRDALREHLSSRGIEVGIHYPAPIHLQAAYTDLSYREGDFPHAERAAKEILSLPMFAELTDNQIERVAKGVREFFDRIPPR
jgi:dTDP-4-amino-4,6-dideoxygalactose transaminase